MGRWIGYFGPGDAAELTSLLGPQAQTHIDAGFGLGIEHSSGEPAALTVLPDGRVVAALGESDQAGCAASVDSGRLTLTLCCDPFGKHSVVAAQVGETFWFASDLRLLRRHRGIGARLDPVALHGYLCFSHVPSPCTIFAGISVLPAGSRLIVIPGERHCKVDHAWREGETEAVSPEMAAAKLRRLLQEAVTRQIGVEREAGVFLSGGLDSSLVAALLVEAGVQTHLFTLDFGPPFDAELPYARQVAAHLGRPLQIVPAGPSQVRAALEQTAVALEQPFGDGVTVPLSLLGQAAAQQVGIVFNGEGGDQLFGGWANKPMVAAELYGGPDYDREAAYLETYHRFYGQTDSLYTGAMQVAVGAVDVGAWIRPALNAEGFRSLLHRLRAANLALKGAQNIAPRARQLAEAHGLRLRMPFFDRALTEWTFTLPPEWFLSGACEKYLLKRVAESYLPAEVVWREKRGMGVPVTDWCLGPLRREVARRLTPRTIQRDGRFRVEAVEALRRGEDRPGEFRRRRLGEKLWALLLFHVWQAAQGKGGHA